jgi:CRP/FNR family transcriptional regulator
MVHSLIDNTYSQTQASAVFPLFTLPKKASCIPISRQDGLSTHRIFQRKNTLYYSGDVFEGIYMLKSGSAKALVFSSTGEEHVVNFFLPGDIIGIEGFSQQQHQHTLVFLETSSVVLFKEAEIYQLLKTSDDFRRNLLMQMSSALILEEQRQLASKQKSSKQRIAEFLLTYSSRLQSSGLNNDAFTLSMSRTDIANHNGMAIETASRVFKQLQQDKLILVNNRFVHILNPMGLRHVLINGLTALD